MLPTFHSSAFTVIKFEPNNILLQDNLTRKLYCYDEPKRNIQFELEHELIMKGEPLSSGLIYEKQLTTLLKQIQPKIHNSSAQPFTETELNNTFQPILSYLQRGRTHGCINLENILIDHSGAIRLKDPRLTVKSSNENDYAQLGKTILQSALLVTYNQATNIDKSKQNIATKLLNYSPKFISNLWILINNVQGLKEQIELSNEMPNNQDYKKLIQEFDLLKKLKTSTTQKILNFKPSIEKRVIVIPPLNLKFNKAKKPNFLKQQFSNKKRTQNENENQQSAPKKLNNIIEQICLKNTLRNKNQEPKIKLKRIELNDNLKSPLKRKGKTLQKKIKQCF